MPAVAPVEPLPSIVTEPAKPIPAATSPSSEHVADTAAPRAARRSAAADTPAEQAEARTQRTAKPPSVQKREPATASAADEAECARIFQRLSLGESNAALLSRLKTLKCQ
jgi:hypothetical protein